MVRDSLEAHKDRHAPLLRRFGAALLWRFVVGEAAGQVMPSPPPPFPLDLSHHEERGSSVARLAPFHPLRPHCFHVQPAEALRALRVREQPLLFEPLLSRHVHALYLAQWGEAHDEVQQPQEAA